MGHLVSNFSVITCQKMEGLIPFSIPIWIFVFLFGIFKPLLLGW